MASFLIVQTLFLFSFPIIILGSRNSGCQPTRCREDGPLIKFPFRLMNSQPQHCGNGSAFDLYCNENQETVLHLPVSLNVSLRTIDYKSEMMEFYDPENCLAPKLPNLNLSSSPFGFLGHGSLEDYILFNCSAGQVNFLYGSTVYCLGGNGYQVVALSSDYPVDMLSTRSCTRILQLQSVSPEVFNRNFLHLTWSSDPCNRNRMTSGRADRSICSSSHVSWKLFLPGATVGSCFFVATAVYILNELIKTNKKTEKFLEDYEALKPTRFSYADIQRITNCFTEKLGEGGYGTVYKGKLSNKIYVAVKLLNNIKGNGEEFVNEVITMGSRPGP